MARNRKRRAHQCGNDFICAECARARHAATQEQIAGYPPEWFVGRLVKVPLVVDGNWHHVWVEVSGVTPGGNLAGVVVSGRPDTSGPGRRGNVVEVQLYQVELVGQY